jgi:hypothetical protein
VISQGLSSHIGFIRTVAGCRGNQGVSGLFAECVSDLVVFDRYNFLVGGG